MASSKPTIKIFDSATGEESERPMTAEEIEAFEATKAQSQAEEEARLAKETARQSALEKLAALGLTEAEIQALTA